jgi:hypothetical protein
VSDRDDTRDLGSYFNAVRQEDATLQVKLAEIRTREDAGEVTVRQAADIRIAAMEQHLAELRELRAQFFGRGEEETP